MILGTYEFVNIHVPKTYIYIFLSTHKSDQPIHTIRMFVDIHVLIDTWMSFILSGMLLNTCNIKQF